VTVQRTSSLPTLRWRPSPSDCPGTPAGVPSARFRSRKALNAGSQGRERGEEHGFLRPVIASPAARLGIQAGPGLSGNRGQAAYAGASRRRRTPIHRRSRLSSPGPGPGRRRAARSASLSSTSARKWDSLPTSRPTACPHQRFTHQRCRRQHLSGHDICGAEAIPAPPDSLGAGTGARSSTRSRGFHAITPRDSDVIGQMPAKIQAPISSNSLVTTVGSSTHPSIGETAPVPLS
jgi:hypothetical protein